eukprot:5822958-Amphidinium_carterae.1
MILRSRLPSISGSAPATQTQREGAAASAHHSLLHRHNWSLSSNSVRLRSVMRAAPSPQVCWSSTQIALSPDS